MINHLCARMQAMFLMRSKAYPTENRNPRDRRRYGLVIATVSSSLLRLNKNVVRKGRVVHDQSNVFHIRHTHGVVFCGQLLGGCKG